MMCRQFKLIDPHLALLSRQILLIESAQSQLLLQFQFRGSLRDHLDRTIPINGLSPKNNSGQLQTIDRLLNILSRQFQLVDPLLHQLCGQFELKNSIPNRFSEQF